MAEAKTWLITGCSTGLGRNIAKVLLENGENVAVTAREALSLKNGKNSAVRQTSDRESRLICIMPEA